MTAAHLAGGGVLKNLPWEYRLDQLAQRWHVAPYQIEAALADPLVQLWVRRGLIFMNLEAVEVK